MLYNFAQHPPQCHNTRPKAIGREFVRPAAAKHRQPGQGPAQARPAARAEPAARSAHITRRTHAARLVYHCRAPRARPARCSRRPCRPSRRLPSSPLQRPRGDQRARHARSVRQSSAHPQPACARHGCQLATRPRAELQRAARARVGHPAGAAAAAAAAAACPGARGAAVPARAPRLTRALDALHVWDACPALALAQGAALRAFPMGLGSSRHRLCWPAAAGSRTGTHSSFHTCPSSHTVVSGPTGGREVGGVPWVPWVAEEAPPKVAGMASPTAFCCSNCELQIYRAAELVQLYSQWRRPPARTMAPPRTI
jgi:hypothetical protein